MDDESSTFSVVSGLEEHVDQMGGRRSRTKSKGSRKSRKSKCCNLHFPNKKVTQLQTKIFYFNLDYNLKTQK